MAERFGFIAAFLILLAGCVAVPRADVSVDYYQVGGRSEKTIERQLALHGPNIPGKGRAVAAALISLEQRIDIVKTAERCRVRDAQIKVKADVTLPQWKERSSAAPDLRRRWDAFADYAAVHEAVHIRIAEVYAADLERQLKAIPPQKTCDDVAKIAKRVSDDLLGEMNKAQDQFDADEARRIAELAG